MSFAGTNIIIAAKDAFIEFVRVSSRDQDIVSSIFEYGTLLTNRTRTSRIEYCYRRLPVALDRGSGRNDLAGLSVEIEYLLKVAYR